jgi:hypothetical protein
MGYDLCGRTSDFRCSTCEWSACLDLAQVFGWTPAGTTAPGPQLRSGDKWGGGYLSNDWQYVEDHDAAGMAKGLEAALVAGASAQELTVAQNLALQQLLTADSTRSSLRVDSLEELPKLIEEAFSFKRTSNLSVDLGTLLGLAGFCSEGGFYIT